MTRDNLEEAVNAIRAELGKGFGGSFRIEYPGLHTPLDLDVIVDGITWIVTWKLHGKALEQHVDGREFTHWLYIQMRGIIDGALGRKTKLVEGAQRRAAQRRPN